MAYQVWSRDQHGRHEVLSVLSTKGRPESEWSSIEGAHEAAKRYVHEKNRNNPMTFDEQKKDVSFVVFEPSSGGVYAGALIHGKHKVITKTAAEDQEVKMAEGQAGSFYLGQDPDNKPWYFTTPRKQPIVSLDDSLLGDKTIVFVHKI